MKSIHILLATKFFSLALPAHPSCCPSLVRSFVRSFCCLIVFWFILLAGYYRSVEGANVSYLPSRVRCHSELPSVASVGDHRMGLRWTRTGRESGVVGCLSIKCHRCSIALVFPPATPRGSCPLSCTAFQLRCVCFLFAWLLVCFALPGDGLSLDQAPATTPSPSPLPAAFLYVCPLRLLLPLPVLVVVVLVLSGVWPPYLCTCRIALHT